VETNGASQCSPVRTSSGSFMEIHSQGKFL
jgi:hypothetical protein